MLASAGLIAWLVVAGGSTESSRDVSSGPARSAGVESSPTAVESSPLPSDDEVLAAFRSLDRLRAGLSQSDSGRVLVSGRSVRRLERHVPTSGRTVDLKVLSLARDQVRIRQVIDLSSWDVDLSGEDLSVARAGRRLGIEWTLVRRGDDWRIAAWTIVEDRALVGGQ